MLLTNNFSGTTNIQNLIQINKIYEIMRESILQENNIQNQQQQNVSNPYNFNGSNNTNNNNNNNQPHPLNLQGVTNIFTTIKQNKLFMTIKGQKIFNIVKDNSEQVKFLLIL